MGWLAQCLRNANRRDPRAVRDEFTVGVAGCGKRTTFVVVCPDEGDGCFATGPGRFVRD
jgi:hypothetical protein